MLGLGGLKHVFVNNGTESSRMEPRLSSWEVVPTQMKDSSTISFGSEPHWQSGASQGPLSTGEHFLALHEGRDLVHFLCPQTWLPKSSNSITTFLFVPCFHSSVTGLPPPTPNHNYVFILSLQAQSLFWPWPWLLMTIIGLHFSSELLTFVG